MTKTSEMNVVKISHNGEHWTLDVPVGYDINLHNSLIDTVLDEMVPYAHHTMVVLVGNEAIKRLKDHPNLIKDYEFHKGENTPYRRLVESKDEHE